MDHLRETAFDSPFAEDGARLLRRTFALARFAKGRGNGPYGALLARGGSVLVEGENTENEPDGDLTCHAETVLLRRAAAEFSRAQFEELTLYASTEPCPMCAGAIALSGVKRLVYGASAERAAERTGSPLAMDCRVILSILAPELEVVGPVLELEALECL